MRLRWQLKFKKSLNKNNKQLIYIISGEPSGDLHGSYLMQELKSQSQVPLSFRGLGGPLMQQEGLKSVEFFEKLSVMGFFEVLKVLPFFLKLKKKIINDIRKHRPHKIILIDYPGFNLKIAKAIKGFLKTKIYYYISPQLWAWKEKRIEIIVKYVDEMIVVFPFEVDWYKKRGVNVQYFGHPLIDLYKNNPSINNKNQTITVGLFPGSRNQEIKKHSAVIKDTIKILNNQIKNIHFIVGVPKQSNPIIIKNLGLQSNYTVVANNAFDAFNKSDVAIVASGTATLECAISKTPFVVIYKTSLFSWLLTSWLVKVRFASIVNILANKLIAPEFLQKRCLPNLIATKVIDLINSDNQQFETEVEKLVCNLGEGSAYNKTGNYILNN